MIALGTLKEKSSWKKKKGENRKKLAKYSNKLLGTFIGILHFKMKCGCNQFSHTPTKKTKKLKTLMLVKNELKVKDKREKKNEKNKEMRDNKKSERVCLMKNKKKKSERHLYLKLL